MLIKAYLEIKKKYRYLPEHFPIKPTVRHFLFLTEKIYSQTFFTGIVLQSKIHKLLIYLLFHSCGIRIRNKKSWIRIHNTGFLHQQDFVA